jgi:hypothetical protein
MNIDYDWLVEMNSVADLAENDYTILQLMSNEQLSYLVYWNWGYSGVCMVEVASKAKSILISRGVDYESLGAEIEELVSQYY